MQCLYCGKQLGLLRGLANSEFCSGDHRQRYKRLTARALTRLMEGQPAQTQHHPPQHQVFRELPPPSLAENTPVRSSPALGPSFARPTSPALPPLSHRFLRRGPALAAPRILIPPAATIPAVAFNEPSALPFRALLANALEGEFRLKTVHEPPPVAVGNPEHLPCLTPRSVELQARESARSHAPISEVQAKEPVSTVCLPASIESIESSGALGTAAYFGPVFSGQPLAPRIVSAPVPLFSASRINTPQIRAVNGRIPALSGLLPLVEPESATTDAVRAGDPTPLPHSARINVPGDLMAGMRIPEPAGALPIAVNGAVGAGSIMGSSGPLPCAWGIGVRRPTIKAAPDRLALAAKGAVVEEIFGAHSAENPVDVPATLSGVSGAALPALASLFKYGRVGRPEVPFSHVNEGVTPRNRPLVPAAYMEMAMPAQRPRIPRTTGLRIVETFEYLKPLDAPPFDPFQALVQLWRRAPVYLRYAAAAACLILLLRVLVPGDSVGDLVATRWSRIEQNIAQRAAIELTDDFQGKMENWEGQGDWPRTWQVSKAGYVRPGRLAIYQPSVKMQEYQVEFLMQVEKKAVSWAYRATDQENYYASKISIVKPGPLPVLSLIRYPVVHGHEGPKVEIPIRVLLHNNTPYRVQLSVTSGGYTTSIEGQLVDFWRDDSLKVGGFGFFSDTGESARVYWMRLSHNNDFIGRVCAYFDPVAVQRRRPRLTP